LFNGLGTQALPEVFISQFRLVASGDVNDEERSGGSELSDVSVPPFVCGAGPLGSGIYAKGARLKLLNG